MPITQPRDPITGALKGPRNIKTKNMFAFNLSLSETVHSISAGSLLPQDFINDLCDRIEAVDGHVRSLLPEPNRRERLLSELNALVKQHPDPGLRPPLFGIPVGVKDIFAVSGFETRAGSRLPSELFEGRESAAVTALKNAGALILGKTVTTEFAYYQPGPTRNPHNTEHTPGGSSSGSAAAVAAGLTPLALGTQTIGSISRPASYCGVFGLKPSLGRIPTTGVVPLSPSADHVGFFTQDIEGVELVCPLLINDWNETAEEKKQMVVGIPAGKYLQQVAPEILHWFYRKAGELERAGFKVVEKDVFGDIQAINDAHRNIVSHDFAVVHNQWFSNHETLYGQHAKELISEGRAVSRQMLSDAKNLQTTFRNHIAHVAGKKGIDIWLSPSALDTAPKGLQSTGSPLMNLPWTFLGMPVLSIPAGKDDSGLPLGLQAAASYGSDELLTAWCKRATFSAT